ncbi:hypothetical protein BSZ22_33520 [Bradyrhizobium canariense]|uniref:Uncharacterized protein n=1 Tax=Bradyrhizobium canariense TaxID=255045 RepID=A0A1X3F6W3_9BRAD|nr:hypothetical protein BSZ21_29540 [Bradyrhizobium canariense]OSI64882.1 hypothetical protein BSZ22_33520 [Bradyrhizobium canariense]OSI74219.1 hypothetical protein BSZ23_33365 [Bradyrhizobium canariense]OSI84579.1 hypothetical protein BSZ25_35565 [Bradyrhizobium canariense]OSI93372.1 hypothetical protein BSZ24_13280 [Bradyrhizobium canariense]
MRWRGPSGPDHGLSRKLRLLPYRQLHPHDQPIRLPVVQRQLAAVGDRDRARRMNLSTKSCAAKCS